MGDKNKNTTRKKEEVRGETENTPLSINIQGANNVHGQTLILKLTNVLSKLTRLTLVSRRRARLFHKNRIRSTLINTVALLAEIYGLAARNESCPPCNHNYSTQLLYHPAKIQRCLQLREQKSLDVDVTAIGLDHSASMDLRFYMSRSSSSISDFRNCNGVIKQGIS